MTSQPTGQQLDLDAIEAVIRAAIPLGADIAPETAGALLAEVRRLRAVLDAALAKHKPRTERHGSGCVQCGTVWPCTTYRDLNAAARPSA